MSFHDKGKGEAKAIEKNASLTISIYLVWVLNPLKILALYIYLFKKIILFYLFLAVLGLRCCAQAFSSCGERGPLLTGVCRLLIAVASPVAEHGL